MNMVKKLVCGVISAAVALGAASAYAAGTLAYVQDGLIACWDGIENAGAGVHDGSAMVWKDVVGGYEFNLTGVTVEDSRMTFAGTATSYGALSAAGTADTFGAAMNGTLEIVYVTRDNSVGQILLQTPRDSVGMAFGDIISGTTHLLVPYNGAAAQPAFAFSSGATTNSVSVRYTSGAPVSARANGAALSELNTGNLSGEGTETIIGTRINKESSHFPGSIYCIRLYSRQLTDEEIAANNIIDKKRFVDQLGDNVLYVSAAPKELSSPSPAYGKHSGLAAGDTLAVSGGADVTNSYGMVSSCVGWKLYDISDSVVSNGTGNSFIYTHPTPAAFRRLEWQWGKRLVPTNALPVGGAAFHVDASLLSTMTTVAASDGRQLVTEWRDADGGAMKATAGTGSRPWLVTDDGLPYLDFGAQKNGSPPTSTDVSGYLAWSSSLSTIREVFLVFSDYPGSKHSFFLGASNSYHFHRDQKKLFNSQYASDNVKNGLIEVDGVERAISYELPEGFHLIHLRTTGNVTASNFARDRANINHGGQRLREVAVYTKTLTDDEAEAVSDYLHNKWFDKQDLLVVDAAPEQLGSPSPRYGIFASLVAGDTRVVSCGEAVVTNSADDIEYTCAGWRLYDANDNIVDSGNTLSFTYTHPTPAALRRLEWQWQPTAVKGTVSAGAGGSVSPSGTAWYAADTPITVTATPDSGKQFVIWTGTMPAVSDLSASVTFTPTAPFEMTANFGTGYYVATTGSDDGDGSEDHPFATISNAIEKAAAEIDQNGGRAVIHLDAGTYTESGLAIDHPISVVGASRDGVIINDNVAGKRAFTLSHDDALVSSLTITNFGLRTNGGQGGHIWMSAGKVVDCVIRDGRAAGSAKGVGHGGNVWMSGGRLERCFVVNGRANWGGFAGQDCNGMGLYASGGVIDSCFFKDNRDDNNDGRNWGSVYLAGTATLVNCTVTGGYSRYGQAAGIYIYSSNAKAVNCVAYGNYGNKEPIVNTAASNFGTSNLNRYFNCAAAFTNASCSTWTVLTDNDFVNYVPFSGKTFTELASYMNSEAYANFDWHQRLESSLVDRGTTDPDYRPADGATLDLDGTTRVSGVSVDLGCWECDQSQFTCSGRLASFGVLEDGDATFHAVAVGPASDIVYRWDYGNSVTEETREATHIYRYPDSGHFTVRVSASPDGGSTWSDWYTLPIGVAVAPAQMFVNSECATPVFPYKTRATAANTLGAAIGLLTNNVSRNKTVVDGVDIVVLNGSRSNDTGFFLASAVTVRGESSDPTGAEIVDHVAGFRAFTITSPDAVVSNLTISGNGYRTTPSLGGEGGHIWMSAGLVANCVIMNGRASAQKNVGRGGNVWMSGGRLERCLVTGGAANWGGYHNVSYGMGLYATGGVIDNCWFKDNKDDNSDGHNDGGVCLDGAATLVNCTVTGGWARDYSGHGTGIYVKDASAKVVNCVAYGNYSYFRGSSPYATNTLASNCGNANLSRYFYCGSAFTNTSCATWTVLDDKDFVNYETFKGSTHAELTAYMTSDAYSKFNWHQKRTSKLIDRGTTDPDYRPADSVTLDLDGNPRIQDRSIDLGCWEVASGIGFFIRLR